MPDSAIVDADRPDADRIAGLERENAALRRQLAERTAERDEALAQQTATAEVLQVINSSPGDLAPVFDAILEKAMRLCEAAFGMLGTVDRDELRTVAARGLPEPYVEFRRNNPPVQGPGRARILAGERIVHIRDLADEEFYRTGDPDRRAIIGLGGARTVLLVALERDGVVLGHIGIYRQEVQPFSEKQIALLQNFAAQAVIAMENARLLTETREALEQQTATAEVLQVINASPGDLAPVFNQMLEKATRLCEAVFGVLVTVNGDRIETVAERNVPERLAEFIMREPMPLDPATNLGRTILERRVVHILDNSTSDAYRQRAPLAVASVEFGGVRTILHVPLLKDDAVIGVFIVFRQEVRPFSDKQIALLENFAAQAVIAIENARLLTETREALEQQTATAEVLQVINSSPGELDPVFDAMLERASRLCEAELGTLWTFDGEEFWPAVALDPDIRKRRVGRRPAPNEALGRILRGDDIVHVLDVTAEPGYLDHPEVKARTSASGTRTVLSVALRKDGRLLGAITTGRRSVRPHSDKQIALLQNFAAQAVIAMENARLLGELRQRTRDLEESLEYQTATSDVLQVISRSTFDLQPVLQTLIETAARLCGAARGGIALPKGEAYRYEILWSYSPDWTSIAREMAFTPGRGTLIGRVLLESGLVHIPDVAADQEYAVPGTTHSGTLLGVPMLREGQPIGVLVLARQQIEPFTERQIALVQNFAAQAVIAMENARLLGELRARNDEIAGWNRELEERVAAQVAELERAGKLKRFLAPQLAELIVARGDENILETHRRDIVVVFCDLRGFTAFAETAEPEEVLELLREYHGALGPVVAASEGTLDHFSGDGIMVFFNDPVPVPDASERAVRMAIEMRAAMARLQAQWRRQGRAIGFGVGIARGYATLGQIGFADRIDYTAIGTVCNLAARLCAEAKDGQILVSRRVAAAVEDSVRLEEVGDLALKGLMQAVAVYNVACEQ
jgi:GAF domain-containing protein